MWKTIRSFENTKHRDHWNSIQREVYATGVSLENTVTHYSDYLCLINTGLRLLQILLIHTRDITTWSCPRLSSGIPVWGLSHKTQFTAAEDLCCNAVPPSHESFSRANSPCQGSSDILTGNCTAKRWGHANTSNLQTCCYPWLLNKFSSIMTK